MLPQELLDFALVAFEPGIEQCLVFDMGSGIATGTAGATGADKKDATKPATDKKAEPTKPAPKPADAKPADKK